VKNYYWENFLHEPQEISVLFPVLKYFEDATVEGVVEKLNRLARLSLMMLANLTMLEMTKKVELFYVALLPIKQLD
jgi:hypothetical protein